MNSGGYDRIVTQHGMIFKDRETQELLVNPPTLTYDFLLDLRCVRDLIGIKNISGQSKYSIESVRRVFKPSCLGGNLSLSFYRSIKQVIMNELYQKYSVQEIVQMRKKHNNVQIFNSNVIPKSSNIKLTKHRQNDIRTAKRNFGISKLSEISGYSQSTISKLMSSSKIGHKLDLEKGTKLLNFISNNT